MLKKWLTTVLLAVITLLLIIIVYLLYSNHNNTNTLRRTDTAFNASSSNENSSNDDLLSLAKIRSIFYKRYPNTSITSIELEKNLSSKHYDITGVDDNTAYTLKIHADTGKVIAHNTEQLDADEKNGTTKNNDAIAFDNIISLESAVNKAKDVAGGGSLNEWSLEKDDGRTYWEVTLKDENSDVTVKLDASNGQVIEKDEDD
ncbi:PepSY domain-containing protein [Leuconostoc mesenteroides]